MERPTNERLLSAVPHDKDRALAARHIAMRLGLPSTMAKSLGSQLRVLAKDGLVHREIRGAGNDAVYRYWRTNGRPVKRDWKPPQNRADSLVEIKRLRRMIGNLESLRADYEGMPDIKMEHLCRLERQRIAHILKFILAHPDG